MIASTVMLQNHRVLAVTFIQGEEYWPGFLNGCSGAMDTFQMVSLVWLCSATSARTYDGHLGKRDADGIDFSVKFQLRVGHIVGRLCCGRM